MQEVNGGPGLLQCLALDYYAVSQKNFSRPIGDKH